VFDWAGLRRSKFYHPYSYYVLLRQDCVSTQNKDLLGGKILLQPVDPVGCEGLEIHSLKEETSNASPLQRGRCKFYHAKNEVPAC
jgi:hypothetical protein